MSLANNLKTAMKHAGITAQRLAESLDINKSSVSQYLSDKNMPRKETLEKMAIILHVTVDYLLGGDPVIYESDDKKYRNVPIQVAAVRLGVGPQAVRLALKQGVAPFGFAIENGTKCMYHISEKKLNEYIGEEHDTN